TFLFSLCSEPLANPMELDVCNKLFSIKPKIGNTPLHSSYRKEDVTITRLRIGHSYFTHSHLLSNFPHPVCTSCQADISINHLLLDCSLFVDHRRILYPSNSIFDFFQNNSSQLILIF
ncbi:hypothetical protein, partial [Salmonella sp. s55004]|uniref:hypothetical protein n=1 Tax=Salmonella sp. s55004 TaxID=3159675 RepID=UPI00398085C8